MLQFLFFIVIETLYIQIKSRAKKGDRKKGNREGIGERQGGGIRKQEKGNGAAGQGRGGNRKAEKNHRAVLVGKVDKEGGGVGKET